MKKNSTALDFGKRLAKFRRAKGLTQQDLGDNVGVSRRVIAYYEGETNYPPAHLIVPLSKALGVSSDELLGMKQTQELRSPEFASLWRKLKVVETFNEQDKKAVLHYVKTIADRNKSQRRTPVIEKKLKKKAG